MVGEQAISAPPARRKSPVQSFMGFATWLIPRILPCAILRLSRLQERAVPDEAKFMLNLLKRSAARNEFAARLEAQLIARARAPFFFRALNVPDTMDGRFDLVALHGWL